MHYHILLDSQCHLILNLAGADWSIIDPAGPATVAGRYVARRYNVNPASADVIAHLAGLGSAEGPQ